MSQKVNKSALISLPASLVLTKEGFDFLAHGKTPIVRVPSMRSDIKKDGLDAKQGFNGQVIQKMVMNSYLEEIYIAKPDLLSKRFEIISTNNLIVYGILYKKLSPTLAEKVLMSNVVKDFNRKNPKYSIVDYRSIPKKVADDLVAQKASLFEIIFNDLRDQVHYLLLSSTSSDEDKQMRGRALNKFIRWIDNRIWYLYYLVYQSPMQKEMEETFAEIIFSYLDNTSIAAHMSNLVMEFVQNAEKAHFERIIVRNNLAPKEEVDIYLRKSENRKTVRQIAARSRELLEMSWNMNPGRGQIGKQYRILVRISNFGMIDEITRAKLSQKMKTNTEGIAISDLFTDFNANKLGAGLGLLYNSYLEDFCKSKKIKYSCSLFPEPSAERTTVQIEIIL